MAQKEQDKNTISRRGALTVLSGSVCAAIHLPTASRAGLAAAAGVANVASDAAPAAHATARLFSPSQMESIAALAEAILPADDHSPGAKAARVDLYIDEIIAASDAADKKFWAEGLAAVDKLANDQS